MMKGDGLLVKRVFRLLHMEFLPDTAYPREGNRKTIRTDHERGDPLSSNPEQLRNPRRKHFHNSTCTKSTMAQMRPRIPGFLNFKNSSPHTFLS